MSIDLHDSVTAGHHAAKRARDVALETVGAARDVDLHTPAEAAKRVAKRATKRAAREAAAAAARTHRHPRSRGSRRIGRVIIVAVLGGAVVGIALAVVQRRRNASAPYAADVAPDPFGAAVTEEREIANV